MLVMDSRMSKGMGCMTASDIQKMALSVEPFKVSAIQSGATHSDQSYVGRRTHTCNSEAGYRLSLVVIQRS